MYHRRSVRASKKYKLLIILSPSGAYYGGDTLKSTKIYVEDEYVRAVRGGVGFAKVAGKLDHILSYSHWFVLINLQHSYLLL
jgi:branched-subunit amino acid aminotransferase/4-amino-4-deoxychorismate lyase